MAKPSVDTSGGSPPETPVAADERLSLSIVIPRSRLPSHPALVRAYLALRPAWLLLGKQTLYVGERPT